MTIQTADSDRDEALRHCESEPIHRPGHIQPHGVLLGLDPIDLRVVLASENADRFLGCPASGLIGRGVDEAVAPSALAEIQARAGADGSFRQGSFLSTIDRDGASWIAQARVHRSGDRIVLELEPADAPDHQATASFSILIEPLVAAAEAPGSVAGFCQWVSEVVQQISGYDDDGVPVPCRRPRRGDRGIGPRRPRTVP